VRRRAVRFGLIVWTLALTLGSLQPRRAEFFRIGVAHQLTHVLYFGILALLANAVFSRSRWLIWTALVCWLFGVGLEVSQHFIYRKDLEWGDIRDDGIGVVVGLSILALVLRLACPSVTESKEPTA
jgi:hypothetical protein